MQRSFEDQTYDAERLAKRECRLRLAVERGEALSQVEDSLASVNGASHADRHCERERLRASRARLGW